MPAWMTTTRVDALGAGRLGSRTGSDRIGTFPARRESKIRDWNVATRAHAHSVEHGGSQTTIQVRASGDVIVARQHARALAQHAGFDAGDLIVIDSVLGELAANMLRFAVSGELVISTASECGKLGLVIVARDSGPGIPDVSRALADGFSTANRPGLGLGGARRLVDSFEVVSSPGKGTTITTKKWHIGRR